MPDRLDDFDLEPTRRAGDDETISSGEPGPGRRRGGLGFPVLLAVFAVVAVGVLAVLFLVFRHPAAPEPTPIAPATAAPLAAATPPPFPAVSLPALDESDSFVRELAASLSSNPDLARWLARSALVRTLTAVVANIAAGETPRAHLEFLAPKQRFRAARRPGRRIVPDPAGFAGYDLFAAAVVSVDAGQAASAYRTLSPLFEAAYAELGHPEGGFDKVLDAAIKALLAVPVLGDDVELVPHAVGFRYADPGLERLTAAQKQFLRIGPANVRRVQGKLRELQAALAAPAGPAPEAATP